MTETLPALISFAAAMSFTPGPNNVMATASGTNFGFRRSVPMLLGIMIGFAVMFVVLGFGAAGLFVAFPAVHGVLKFAGAAYMLFLAWRIAIAGGPAAGGAGASPPGFLAAAAFQWVNPKGWVFALGALSTYTTVGGDLAAEIAILTLVIALFCLAATTTWCGFGVAIGRWLESARARTAFNLSMAVLLVASVAAIFV